VPETTENVEVGVYVSFLHPECVWLLLYRLYVYLSAFSVYANREVSTAIGYRIGSCINPEVCVLCKPVLAHDADEVSYPRVYAEVVLFLGSAPLLEGFVSLLRVALGVANIAGKYLLGDRHVRG